MWYPDYEKKPNSTIIDTTDNPFMVGYYLLHPEPIGEAETRLENMYVPLGAISGQCFSVTWIPFECEYFGNPALDAGDCIKIENYDGTETTSVISHNTFRFRNTQKLRCAGEDTRLMTGVRTENKRLYEITEKKVNDAKGKSLTMTELNQLQTDGKLIEGMTYYVIGD